MEYYIEVQNTYTCKKCDQDFIFMPEEAIWKEYATYSLKLAKCPYCKCLQGIKFKSAAGLNVNGDSRYYSYHH